MYYFNGNASSPHHCNKIKFHREQISAKISSNQWHLVLIIEMKKLVCSWAIGGFIFFVLRGTKTPISLNEWSYFCSLLTFMTTSTSLWPCSLPIETTRQLNVKGNFAFDLICLLESVKDLSFLLLIQINSRFLIFNKERLK